MTFHATTNRSDTTPELILKTGKCEVKYILSSTNVPNETTGNCTHCVSHLDPHHIHGARNRTKGQDDDEVSFSVAEGHLPKSPCGAAREKRKIRLQGVREDIIFVQKRIVELRHAARCRGCASACPDPTRCRETKRLFSHVLRCQKGRGCDFDQCFLSKRIMHHYQSCTDRRCPMCGPVKTAICRSAHLQLQKDNHLSRRAESARRPCLKREKLQKFRRPVTFAPAS